MNPQPRHEFCSPRRPILPLLDHLSSDRLHQEQEDILAEAVGESDEVSLGNQADEAVESRALQERK